MDFNNLLMICIPFIAAILGIALPIIVQSIARIDERYDSIRLVKRFKKEPIYWLFLGSLILVIIITFYNSIVCLPWKSDWGGFFNMIMRNSSDILLMLSTVILIVFLFLMVKLIIGYYDYQELFNSIKMLLYNKGEIKKDLRNNENDIYDFFELAKFIARKDGHNKLKDFYEFLYDYSTLKESKNEEFDDWFYHGIISINDVVSKENVHFISLENENNVVKLLIPMVNPEYVISDKTYQVLWRILQQQLFYDRTELVFEYWTYAHQFISLYLTPVDKVSDYQSDKLTVVNKEEVKKREAQIDGFKEFHLALCGMLLYYKKHELINRITKFSQSEPYSFPLIPSSFQEIVLWFSKLNLDRWERPFHIEQSYWLREERGVNAGDVMLGSINRFLTLLLYRLNSFEVQHTTGGIGPWDDLTTPIKLKDTTSLLSIIEQMKFFVVEWERENNQKIIESLGWMPTDDDIRPLMKIDQLIEVLNEGK